MPKLRQLSFILFLLLPCFAPSAAAIPLATSSPGLGIDVGSTGVDGVYNPQVSEEIDLETQGTYDPVNWRVVFNFTDVHIPAGVTVTFKNHPSRAPVVWLSQGDILIEGRVVLDGAPGSSTLNSYAEPGPGGFRGGRRGGGAVGWNTSAGLGPGGGYLHTSSSAVSGGGGSFGGSGTWGSNYGNPRSAPGPVYGDPAISQLMGGSGGAAGRMDGTEDARGGGAGGGGILLAANNSIVVSGQLHARGGQGVTSPSSWNGGSGGGGSGGAIRLVADYLELTSGSQVKATGGPGGNWAGAGGNGRIRFEANSMTLSVVAEPAPTTDTPGPIVPPPGTKTIKVLEASQMPFPSDPRGSIGTGTGVADMDLTVGVGTQIVIQTTNVPLNSAVYLRVTGATGPTVNHLVTDGADSNVLTVTGGPEMEAQTSITLNLAAGFSALQATVVIP